MVKDVVLTGDVSGYIKQRGRGGGRGGGGGGGPPVTLQIRQVGTKAAAAPPSGGGGSFDCAGAHSRCMTSCTSNNTNPGADCAGFCAKFYSMCVEQHR